MAWPTKGVIAAKNISNALQYLLNDTSVAFYRVQENVHKHVPMMVFEKKELVSLGNQCMVSCECINDTINEIHRIPSMDSLKGANEWLQKAIQYS